MRLVILACLLSGCTLQQIRDAEVVYCNPVLEAGRSLARAGLTAVTGIHSPVDVCATIEELKKKDDGA